MLTRLYVDGFKNLVDTEVRFGPLTCIAGFNGVGKSNLFDAIHFLAQLADHSFVEAARATRGGGDVADLFTAGGDGVMRFNCDLLIAATGEDEFHQPAAASQTFLRYELTLRLVTGERDVPRVELVEETLGYIPRRDAKVALRFGFDKDWRDSVILTSKRRASFIETVGHDERRTVRLSSDKMRGDGDRRGGGRPADFLARTLPRTVLSAAQNADEARTAVLVRAELRRWRLLQLEPSALRQPDDLQAPSALTTEGRHLPATLYRLAGDDPDPVYADIANRLSELVNNVRGLRVDRDDARRVLRLVMTDASGVELPASSLSDGTLRFIALSVLEKDPTATGLLCLEEPENGIHPERMGAMMRLLGDMVVETYGPIGDGNPLRQVIISTHSPVVAARAQHDQLVFADHRDAPKQGDRPRRSLVIRPVAGTWRDEGRVAPLSRGDIIRFLGALQPAEAEASRATSTIYDVATSGGVQLRLFPGAAQ